MRLTVISAAIMGMAAALAILINWSWIKVPIVDSQGTQTGYARNIWHVYYDGFVVSLADPANFIEIDPETSPGYFEDAHHVFFAGDVIASADRATFRILGTVDQPDEIDVYAIDKNHVYFFGTFIPGADPTTFTLFSRVWQCAVNFGCEAKDKNHYYYQGEMVPDSSISIKSDNTYNVRQQNL
jgi:hypothetical protein